MVVKQEIPQCEPAEVESHPEHNWETGHIGPRDEPQPKQEPNMNELMIIDQNEVERLIQLSITRTMETLQPTGKLWDMKQVAEYLSLTHLYVQNHWRKMKLPEPIRVGTGNQKPRLRWKSDEIRALF